MFSLLSHLSLTQQFTIASHNARAFTLNETDTVKLSITERTRKYNRKKSCPQGREGKVNKSELLTDTII